MSYPEFPDNSIPVLFRFYSGSIPVLFTPRGQAMFLTPVAVKALGVLARKRAARAEEKQRNAEMLCIKLEEEATKPAQLKGGKGGVDPRDEAKRIAAANAWVGAMKTADDLMANWVKAQATAEKVGTAKLGFYWLGKLEGIVLAAIVAYVIRHPAIVPYMEQVQLWVEGFTKQNFGL